MTAYLGIVEDGGYFYASYDYAAAEHGGTHLDAPFHFAEHANTVDRVSVPSTQNVINVTSQIPLHRLIGDACVVNVSRKCAKDRDYRITIDDVRDWENEHARRVDDCILLFRTDYSKYYADKRRYLGIVDTPDGNELHFPGTINCSCKRRRVTLTTVIESCFYTVSLLPASPFPTGTSLSLHSHSTSELEVEIRCTTTPFTRLLFVQWRSNQWIK